MRYYVAAVRDWPESRMIKVGPEFCTEIGSEKSFMTSDYKTLRGLIKYRIMEREDYYNHVWAIFVESRGGVQHDKFVGLQYNSHDKELCDLANRYMKARKYKGHIESGISLYERVS